MMEGRIQKTTAAGGATVESLDPDMVTKLLRYLDLGGSVSCCAPAPTMAPTTAPPEVLELL